MRKRGEKSEQSLVCMWDNCSSRAGNNKNTNKHTKEKEMDIIKKLKDQGMTSWIDINKMISSWIVKHWKKLKEEGREDRCRKKYMKERMEEWKK